MTYQSNNGQVSLGPNLGLPVPNRGGSCILFFLLNVVVIDCRRMSSLARPLLGLYNNEEGIFFFLEKVYTFFRRPVPSMEPAFLAVFSG